MNPKTVTRVLIAGAAAPALFLSLSSAATADTFFDQEASFAGPHGAGEFCVHSHAGSGHDRSGCAHGKGGGHPGGGHPDGGHPGGGHPGHDPGLTVNVTVNNHLNLENVNANDLDNTQLETDVETEVEEQGQEE